MSNKNILIGIVVFVWYFLIFGFTVPTLISAKNDIAPLFGAGLAVIHVAAPIFWFNREKKEDVV